MKYVDDRGLMRSFDANMLTRNEYHVRLGCWGRTRYETHDKKKGNINRDSQEITCTFNYITTWLESLLNGAQMLVKEKFSTIVYFCVIKQLLTSIHLYSQLSKSHF